MGLLGFIGLICNATSSGVSALTVVSWKQLQRVGVAKKRASSGYNGGRCAFLHNRSLWISVKLSGCFDAANCLPGLQGALWWHETRWKQAQKYAQLSYTHRNNLPLIMIPENKTDKFKTVMTI